MLVISFWGNIIYHMALSTSNEEAIAVFDNTADSFLTELSLCQTVSYCVIGHISMTAICSYCGTCESPYNTF